MNDTNIDGNTLDEEKGKIDREQREHREEILEPDEAANSAEGITPLEDDILKDVEEDRDSTTDPALDVPGPNIIR